MADEICGRLSSSSLPRAGLVVGACRPSQRLAHPQRTSPSALLGALFGNREPQYGPQLRGRRGPPAAHRPRLGRRHGLLEWHSPTRRGRSTP